MAKNKEEQPLSLPGVKFVVNKDNTVRWDELAPDHLLEWAAEDKEEAVKLKVWMAKATHGQRYRYGVNTIYSLEREG